MLPGYAEIAFREPDGFVVGDFLIQITATGIRLLNHWQNLQNQSAGFAEIKKKVHASVRRLFQQVLLGFLVPDDIRVHGRG